MAALRIDEDEQVEEGVQKFFDLLTRLEEAELNYTSVSTKSEAVGGGDHGKQSDTKSDSKECNLGETSKACEPKENGAAAKCGGNEEEKPKISKAEAAKEKGESLWGTIASAAFSNPTSATGECDWLTLHRRMGHVALPILQQIVKQEMVSGICIKGEPNE
ncbi:hypothetical protein CLOP_g22608, partial [Closterium sp. NIES-67]